MGALRLRGLGMAFGRRARDAGVLPSTGSVGDCYDNALAEGSFAGPGCALIDRSRWRTHAEARREAVDDLEGCSNPRRRHSALGQLSPADYERRFRTAEAPDAA